MPDIPLADLASPAVLARARKIKLFLMDVDGTLTDGGVCLISSTVADGSGAASVSEMKIFNAKDGQGLSLANTMGIQTGFITGRRSPAVAKRAEELKVTFVYLGQAQKTQAFEECVEKAGVTAEEVAYMGDDLPDIPLAQRAGLAISVADGSDELKAGRRKSSLCGSVLHSALRLSRQSAICMAGRAVTLRQVREVPPQ